VQQKPQIIYGEERIFKISFSIRLKFANTYQINIRLVEIASVKTVLYKGA
jgi:hypothetical protein